MKKMAITTLAAAAVTAGLALAPLASADTAPPVAPGLYTMLVSGSSIPERIAWDCGPSCFAMGNTDGSGTPRDYRFDAAAGQWRNDNFWTSDGTHLFGGPAPGLLVPA